MNSELSFFWSHQNAAFASFTAGQCNFYPDPHATWIPNDTVCQPNRNENPFEAEATTVQNL